MREWARAYGATIWLTVVFGLLLAVFAATPDPSTAGSPEAEPTSEPTPGPRECVVCPLDQRCDPGSGQCRFVDHTPLPCVKTAKFDEEAGFCLPEGAPPPPVVTAETAQPDDRVDPAPRSGRRPRQPRSRGGIGG